MEAKVHSEPSRKVRIVIVGAGPAGLTAAWEAVHAGHDVTVLERDETYVGGLARTMCYQGFRFDIGAHRFFSKNPEITQWWRERLPGDFVRIKRLTRIVYRGRFFDYPLKPLNALRGLGIFRSFACLLSYGWRRLNPIIPEASFADWVRNRFGDQLYSIFFKTYTEKVWGMPCSKISSDWASQRIRGLSLFGAIANAFTGRIEEATAKTLVDEFEYPRFGAGMLWERTRDQILDKGGRVMMGNTVVSLKMQGARIVEITCRSPNGRLESYQADEFIISMPLQETVLALGPHAPADVHVAARELSYRDFILVALIVNRTDLFPDNWVYVHDPAVRVGRIENFNNWTEEMASRPGFTCLEFEYFCSKQDTFWNKTDEEILSLAKNELEKLGFGQVSEVLDGCVVRVEKAYPVYDVHYKRKVEVIRKALALIENLQVIGRNGMHKYNNQDHSMMTGILAVRNLAGGSSDVWRVNTDAEYHEEGQEADQRIMPQQVS